MCIRDREITKVREKIAEYQEKLKSLEAQKTEAENLDIVQMVRALRMTCLLYTSGRLICSALEGSDLIYLPHLPSMGHWRTTVSYTHLDVYKRQEPCKPAEGGTVVELEYSADKDPPNPDFFVTLNGINCAMSVSYTHLVWPVQNSL